MKKTPVTISIQELNEIGATASAEAVAAAHAVGLPTPGVMRLRLVSGNELSVLTMVHPDGVLEIKDNRIQALAHHRPETRSEKKRIASIADLRLQATHQSSVHHRVAASYDSRSDSKDSAFLNAKEKLFASSKPLRSKTTKLTGIGKP